MSFENFQKLIDAFVEAPLRSESEEENNYNEDFYEEEIDLSGLDIGKPSSPAPISLNEVSYSRSNNATHGTRGGRATSKEANAKLYQVDEKKSRQPKAVTGALTQENLKRAGLTKEVDVLQKVHHEPRAVMKKPVVVVETPEEVPTAAPISLDEVSYDREVKYINLPRGSRPPTSTIDSSSRVVKQLHAIAENNAVDFDELDSRYRRMDDLKKQHDSTNGAPVVKKLYEVPASATTARERKPPRKERPPKEGKRERRGRGSREQANTAATASVTVAASGGEKKERSSIRRRDRDAEEVQQEGESEDVSDDDEQEEDHDAVEVEEEQEEEGGDGVGGRPQAEGRRRLFNPSGVNRYLTEAQREQLDLQRELDQRREQSRLQKEQQREARREAKRSASAGEERGAGRGGGRGSRGGGSGTSGTGTGTGRGARASGEGRGNGRRGRRDAARGGGDALVYPQEYDPIEAAAAAGLYYDPDYDTYLPYYPEQGGDLMPEPSPAAAPQGGYYDPTSKTFYPGGAAAAAPAAVALSATSKEFVPSFLMPAASGSPVKMSESHDAAVSATISPTKLNVNAKTFEFAVR